MKKLVLLLFLMFPFVALFAQKSNIYNEKGQLYMDTTLCIPTKYLDDFVNFEKELLPFIFEGIRYPQISADNDIQGEVIIRIYKTGQNKVEVGIEKSSDKLFSKEVLRVLDFYKNRIGNYYMKEGKLEFYIPFKFEIVNSSYKKDLKEKKAVIIKGLKSLRIRAWCGTEKEGK